MGQIDDHVSSHGRTLFPPVTGLTRSWIRVVGWIRPGLSSVLCQYCTHEGGSGESDSLHDVDGVSKEEAGAKPFRTSEIRTEHHSPAFIVETISSGNVGGMARSDRYWVTLQGPDHSREATERSYGALKP